MHCSRKQNKTLGIQRLEDRVMMYGGAIFDNGIGYPDPRAVSELVPVSEVTQKPGMLGIDDLQPVNPPAEKVAAKIFLDFGLGFEESVGPNGENGHYFDLGWVPDWVDQTASVFRGENPHNGEVVYMPDSRPQFGGFEYLNSMEDNLNEFDFDYNSDGAINRGDAELLADHVADAVRRSFEPFDVEVVLVQSNSWDDMLETLASSAGHDSYVLIAGNRFGSGVLGISPLDSDNEHDDIVFAFAEDVFALIDDTDDMHDLVTALGKTVAHEAAHSFGLEHLASPTSAHNDLMYVGQGLTKLTNETFATRGLEMLNESGHYVDPYQYLADTLGLKEGGPAYVTGTGLHDQIELTETVWGDVNVQVDSYLDNGSPADSIQYTIDASHGVLIEAGIGNDTITINGDFDVIARGGRGDDVIMTGGGNDVLEGEAGNDSLWAGLGNDTYRWGRGVLDLGFDRIGDDGGDDTFDFSEFRGPITIDMSQGGYQSLGSTNAGQPHLLIFNYSANGIENIYGTSFADHITGTAGDDKIVGNGGGDTIDGNGGNDSIFYLSEIYSLDLFLPAGDDRGKSLTQLTANESLKEKITREEAPKQKAADNHLLLLARGTTKRR